MDEDDYIIIFKDNYNIPVTHTRISNIFTEMYNIISGTYGIISSTYRYLRVTSSICEHISNVSVMYLLICLYRNPATYMVISIMGHGPFLVAYIVLFKFLGML